MELTNEHIEKKTTKWFSRAQLNNAKQELEYRQQKLGKLKRIVKKNPIKSFIEMKFRKKK